MIYQSRKDILLKDLREIVEKAAGRGEDEGKADSADSAVSVE